jgi:hypothetical protein
VLCYADLLITLVIFVGGVSQISGPDWSSVPSLKSAIPSPEVERKRDGVLGKRTSTGWDQMGFDHYDRRHQEPHQWRGGHSSSYQSRSDAENHRLYHRDQHNDTFRHRDQYNDTW